MTCLAQPRLRLLNSTDLQFDAILQPDGIQAPTREYWGGVLRTFGATTTDRWSLHAELLDDTPLLLEVWSSSPLIISPVDSEGRVICRHVFAAASASAPLLAVTVTADGSDFLIEFGGWMAGRTWSCSVTGAGATIAEESPASVGNANFWRLTPGTSGFMNITIRTPFGTDLTTDAIGFASSASAIEAAINALTLTGATAGCTASRQDLYLHQVTYGTDPNGTDWSGAAIWLDLLDWRTDPARLDLPVPQDLGANTGPARFGNGPTRYSVIRLKPDPLLLFGNAHPESDFTISGEGNRWVWSFELLNPDDLDATGGASSTVWLLQAGSGWQVILKQPRRLSDGLTFADDIDWIGHCFLPSPGTVILGNSPQTVRFTWHHSFSRILGSDGAAPAVDGIDLIDLTDRYFDVTFCISGDARPLARRWQMTITDWPSGSFTADCPDCATALNNTFKLKPAQVNLDLPDDLLTDVGSGFAAVLYSSLGTIPLLTTNDCSPSDPSDSRHVTAWLINCFDEEALAVLNGFTAMEKNTLGLGSLGQTNWQYDWNAARSWEPSRQILMVQLDQSTAAPPSSGTTWHFFDAVKPLRADDDTPASFVYSGETYTDGGAAYCPPNTGTAITVRPKEFTVLPSCSPCGNRETPAAWILNLPPSLYDLTEAEDLLLLPSGTCLWTGLRDGPPVPPLDDPTLSSLWTFSLEEGLQLWLLDETRSRTLIARWCFQPLLSSFAPPEDDRPAELWNNFELNCAQPVNLLLTWVSIGLPDNITRPLPPQLTVTPIGLDCPDGNRDFRWLSTSLNWNPLNACPDGMQTATEPPPRGLADLEVRQRCCSTLAGEFIAAWTETDGWYVRADGCDTSATIDLPTDTPTELADTVRRLPCTPAEPTTPDWLYTWNGSSWDPPSAPVDCPEGTELQEPTTPGTTVGEKQPGHCQPIDCAGKGCSWFGTGTGVGIQSWVLLDNPCPSHCDCPEPDHASFFGETYDPDCVCKPSAECP